MVSKLARSVASAVEYLLLAFSLMLTGIAWGYMATCSVESVALLAACAAFGVMAQRGSWFLACVPVGVAFLAVLFTAGVVTALGWTVPGLAGVAVHRWWRAARARAALGEAWRFDRRRAVSTLPCHGARA